VSSDRMSKSEANNDTPGSSKISRGEPSKQYTKLLREARTTMTSELGMSDASMSRNMAATGRDDVLRGRQRSKASYKVGEAWQAVAINCAVSSIKCSASGQ